MRRVFVLLSACLVMSLVLAPSAMAQPSPGPEGEGPCTGVFEQYIPEVNGCVTTEGKPSRGVGQSIVTDADTGERLGTLDEVNAEIEAGETGQAPELGNSSAAAYDPSNYARSEINPSGPCFDPQTAPIVDGVPVEDLAFAYINRNDPVGTPLVSPLDSDNDGIACNALTRAEAQAIADGGDSNSGNDQYDEDTQQPSEASANDQYAEETGDMGGMGTLPDTGGPSHPSPLVLAGGLALLGGGLLLRRHLG